MGKKGAAAEAAPAEEAPAEAPVVEEPEKILEGDFAWPDGSEYSGQYVMRKDKLVLHGQGRLQTGPEIFEGTFDSGLYREGTFHGADGSVYKGGFRNNAFHGPGEFTWADGRVYRGMWQDGSMHGKGEFENFSFGVDRFFQGFCVKGRFDSSDSGQEAAKRGFLADYGGAYGASAQVALQDIFARGAQVEPVDPKAKKGAAAPDDAPADVPKEYIVALAEEEGATLDPGSEAAATLAEGPFPTNACARATALLQFAGRFAEGAEQPGRRVLLESRAASLLGFDAARLRREQLGHQGQAVAFVADDAEPGSVRLMVLLNVCLTEYSADKASWKLIHCETAPEAAPA